MKIFDNSMMRATNGFACFTYRNHTIYFNDEESENEDCWYLSNHSRGGDGGIHAASVQDAIEAINNLERKLAET